MIETYDCILLAGGVGERTGNDIPKQFREIDDMPMIGHALYTILTRPYISKTIIVYPEYHFHTTVKILHDHFKTFVDQKDKPIVLVKGGNTRRESVWNGLQYVTTPRVIIQEAARPLASKRQFDTLVECGKTAQNIVPVIYPVDTVISSTGKTNKCLNRDNLMCIQLPQLLNTTSLMLAHSTISAKTKGEDDSWLIQQLRPANNKTKISYIMGEYRNMKVTHDCDFLFAEGFISEDVSLHEL